MNPTGAAGLPPHYLNGEKAMKKFSLQEWADFMEEAIFLEQPINPGGTKTINIGIDAHGRDFIAVTDAAAAEGSAASIGYL